MVAPDGGGKGEGMVARPNNPKDKVRQLQRRLYVSAKRNPVRRFHALSDRICRSDVLREAWERVRRNGGAAGVDGETIDAIERQGVGAFLAEIERRLREREYRPQPVRRCFIPKSDGTQRPLGIPAVIDRVVQQATKIVIEPIFEADFLECSFGFRPKKSATDALERLRLLGNRGHRVVVDGDIKSYFDTIDHDVLMKLVMKRISDRGVLKLLRQWLKAGVLEEGKERASVMGCPQGGVISPLLANIYLHVLDATWQREHSHLGVLVRYADDFVVMCKSEGQARAAKRAIEAILQELRLTLHPDKTRIAKLGVRADGFDFLGCHLRIVKSVFKQKTYLFRWPSRRAMARVRTRVRELTDRRRRAGMRDIREVIEDLNPVLRGWGNYFKTGNAAEQFVSVDRYVWCRLTRLLAKQRGFRGTRLGRRVARFQHEWPRERLEALGLHRLRGTIRYPGSTHAT